MSCGSRFPSGQRLAAWVGSLAAMLIVGWFFVGMGQREGGILSEPRLVKIEPLPVEDGEMCQWIPASASMTLVGALLQGQQDPRATAATRAASSNEGGTPPIKPVRTIRDPYASFSAVAVDPVRNEVIMTDQSLLSILVYDRLANTPATANMTEPKRILSGSNTNIEFQCGVYVDPATGDIYALNGDTEENMVIFAHGRSGNVAPDRKLHTPHGTFGIAVDEEAQELYMTLQHDQTVVVFDKTATDEDAPLRLLHGPRTRLRMPHGIAIDPERKLLYVSNYGSYHEKIPEEDPDLAARTRTLGYGKPNWPIRRPIPGTGQVFPPSITVYDLKASGDAPPLRVIEGPKTQLNWPTHVAVDEERQELYVANDAGHSVLTFSTTASGDVAPIRVLKGPKTMIQNPTGVFFDAANDELWVSNFGNHSAAVFKRGATGDVPPLRVIRSGPLGQEALGIGNPHPVAYDSKRDQILVPN
ncbi:MAG: hypothetical protein V3T78_07700 [Dehalococcoidia bacterium]